MRILKLKLIKMRIEELDLKVGDKVRKDIWKKGEYVIVTEGVNRKGRFTAKDGSDHESAYGPHGDDWEKITN